MTTFVGAEYIIAYALIVKYRCCKLKTVDIDAVVRLSYYLQNQANNNRMDVIFLGSIDNINISILNNSDYFKFNRETNEIGMSKWVDISDLESRFIGYLPLDVIKFSLYETEAYLKYCLNGR